MLEFYRNRRIEMIEVGKVQIKGIPMTFFTVAQAKEYIDKLVFQLDTIGNIK